MKAPLLALSFCVAVMSLGSTGAAEVPHDDMAALQALATGFERAWNTHDMKVGFRKLLADDVNWVSVAGEFYPERPDGRIERVVNGHVRVHESVKFKDSVLTIRQTQIELIRPDVAVMHVDWALRGDRDNDGAPRAPREGVFMWVAVKQAGAWKIRASQNTNRTPIK